MNRNVAAVFVLSCVSVAFAIPVSASTQDLSPEEIESQCWNEAVLTNVPLEERDSFVGECIDEYENSLQGRIDDELEVTPLDDRD